MTTPITEEKINEPIENLTPKKDFNSILDELLLNLRNPDHILAVTSLAQIHFIYNNARYRNNPLHLSDQDIHRLGEEIKENDEFFERITTDPHLRNYYMNFFDYLVKARNTVLGRTEKQEDITKIVNLVTNNKYRLVERRIQTDPNVSSALLDVVGSSSAYLRDIAKGPIIEKINEIKSKRKEYVTELKVPPASLSNFSSAQVVGERITINTSAGKKAFNLSDLQSQNPAVFMNAYGLYKRVMRERANPNFANAISYLSAKINESSPEFGMIQNRANFILHNVDDDVYYGVLDKNRPDSSKTISRDIFNQSQQIEEEKLALDKLNKIKTLNEEIGTLGRDIRDIENVLSSGTVTDLTSLEQIRKNLAIKKAEYGAKTSSLKALHPESTHVQTNGFLSPSEITAIEDGINKKTQDLILQELEIQEKQKKVDDLLNDKLERYSEYSESKQSQVIVNSQNRFDDRRERMDRIEDARRTELRAKFDAQGHKKTIGKLLWGERQSSETSARSEDIVLRADHLYENVSEKNLRFLPSPIRSLVQDRISKYGKARSETREYIEYQIDKFWEKKISTPLKGYFDSVAGSRGTDDFWGSTAKRISEKVAETTAKRKRKNPILQIAEAIARELIERIQGFGSDIAEGFLETRFGNAVSGKFNSIKNGISQRLSGVSQKWNEIKLSNGFKNAVKGLNLLKSVGSGIRHLLNGSATGIVAAGAAMLINPALLFNNPGLLLGVYVGGNIIGTAQSFLSSAYNINLAGHNPNNFSFMNGLEKFKIRLAMNNPINGSINSELFSRTTDKLSPLVKSVVDEGGFEKGKNLASVAGLRRIQLGINSITPAIIGGSIAYLLSGGNIWAGIGGGLATGVGSYVLNSGWDKLSMMIANGNSRIFQIMQFPAGALIGTVAGANTIVSQLNLLNRGTGGSWEKFAKEQQKDFLFIPGGQGFMNLVSSVGYVLGVPALADYVLKSIVGISAVPTPWKIAAMLPAAAYMIGGMIMGYEISLGTVLALTGAGIISLAVAGLVGAGTWGLGAVGAYAATTAALWGPSMWVGEKIDEAIEKLTGGNSLAILDSVGLYRLFEGFKNLIDAPLRSIADYTIVVSITFGFITGLPVLFKLIESASESAEEIHPEESEPSGFINTDNNLIAVNYSIPPLIIDCNNKLNKEIHSTENVVIEDIISIDREGELLSNIKAQGNSQKYIFKNMNRINESVVSDVNIPSDTYIGSCN